MRKIKRIYTFFIGIILLAGLQLEAANSQTHATINYQEFYNALSPYGNWINYPGYGNVWHPDVADFRPYATNGYWEYTDGGWFWDSGYEWGWAPFHYGSWMYDNQYGWLWIPGYEWAPSWVTWGEYDDYYAWAPVGPDVDLTLHDGNNRRPVHDYYWNVVPKNNITEHNISHYLVNENSIRENTSRISLINNFKPNLANQHYSIGPDHHTVTSVTGKEITPLRLTDSDRHVAIPADNSPERVIRNTEGIKPVYRPQVTHPDMSNTQSISVRSADENAIRPLRGNSEWPQADLNHQRNNIGNLPVRNVPMHDFGPAGGSMRNQGRGSEIHGGSHR